MTTYFSDTDFKEYRAALRLSRRKQMRIIRTRNYIVNYFGRAVLGYHITSSNHLIRGFYGRS